MGCSNVGVIHYPFAQILREEEYGLERRNHLGGRRLYLRFRHLPSVA